MSCLDRELAGDLLEDAGYDGAWAAETGHDPFLALTLAAEHTERLQLGTGIAVAFARNPMTLASTAWDLNHFSGGRFMLGLGSQIKPHIEKRFSMPWSHPAPRMREFILAMRAIWACWQDGAPLQFEGDFYTHKLMTPMFVPEPQSHGVPKIFVAAVGEAMTEMSGEVADGLIGHAFTTKRYLDEVMLHGTPDKVGDEILRLREEIGLDYLLAAPLSHKTFGLLTEKILPRLI